MTNRNELIRRLAYQMTIGTKVRMIGCAEVSHYKGRIFTVRGSAKLISGDWCVLLDGISGYFMCEYLEIIAE